MVISANLNDSSRQFFYLSRIEIITRSLSDKIIIPQQEMYKENFNIPQPDERVLIS